ncbi:hypothetical protein HNY73_017459 [Argiope bruennichi]|uniref:Uncharacterized protein n=1 Tax=Argiope bruennichi TaxID=94029 RepID=A0A8T0EB28_ARGBR|nr:hypothetical protein HNY73_017459 [Argiope bruennichi]
MKKVQSKVMDALKEEAAKEPLKQVSEGEENDSTNTERYNDSKESYYKRPIEPWPMPCKDGTRISCLPDRAAIIRCNGIKQLEAKEEERKRANPYILAKPLPGRKPQNYGFPLYRMVTLPVATKRLVCTDKNGNKFQLAPTPRYDPFG